MANILSIDQGFPTAVLRYQFKAATGKTFVAGDLVSPINETTVDYATLNDGDDVPVYVVMEGNDTFSGQFAQQVVCISGDFSFHTLNFVSGSYTVNEALTATGGKFDAKTGTKKTLAYVKSYSLTQGLWVQWEG